mgnify:CR=1 FL=1
MQNNSKEGIILVNKPKGITSHDVVDIVRRRLKIRAVGHAGTLDPLAEGLLIMLVGKSTKLLSTIWMRGRSLRLPDPLTLTFM